MTTDPILSLAQDYKWAFTSRRVTRTHAAGLATDLAAAAVGDLVLCRVLAVGQHKRLQLAERRFSDLFAGDLVVLALGCRYAPDQFEGRGVLEGGSADLLAGGGVVGRMERAHDKMNAPTSVEPLGLLTGADGRALNLADYAMPEAAIPDDVTVIAIFGTSMNAGKTTTAVGLAHGLTRAGLKVAGIKATGTGAFGDFNAFEDAGVPASDFTDAGMPTTYRMAIPRIEAGFATLVGQAAEAGARVVVVEFADGVFQAETGAVLGGSIRGRFDGVLFAASDALGCLGGVEVLRRHAITPLALSGTVTQSPMASDEAQRATGLPVLTRAQLTDPAVAHDLVAGILRTRERAA